MRLYGAFVGLRLESLGRILSMHKFSRLTILAATALAAVVAFGAQPQAAGVQAGTLTCNVSSGWGYIIGSSRDLNCVYSPVKRAPEHYSGKVSKFGVDIGYQQSAVIVWTVVAPTADI